MIFIKRLIPYVLFAAMIYLGTRYAFPTWTEEGNGSVTWVEEDGGTKQTYKLFDYHVIFSSSIQLPTAPGSITGAGVDTGFDADKLDGQHGQYYLNASSGGMLVPLTVFNSSMTEVERRDNSKLNASSGTTIVETVLSTMTTAEKYIATKLNASSGTSIANDILGRLPASSGTVIVATILSTMSTTEAYIATKLNASSGSVITPLAVFYGSMTIIESQYSTKLEVIASTSFIQSQIDEINNRSSLTLHFTSATTSSEGYFLLTSTASKRLESSVTRTVGTSATRVLVSSWVYTLGAVDVFPDGQYSFHIHTVAGAANRIRYWYELYEGSGTGVRFINATEQSNIVQTAKESQSIHFSTDAVNLTRGVITVQMFANNAGASTTLQIFMEGSNGSDIELPAESVQIGVTSVNGLVGDITGIATTTQVDTKLNASSGTTISTQLIAYQPCYPYAVFGSTDVSGDVCTSTVVVPVPDNLTITEWHIEGTPSGACKVLVSSCAFGELFGRIDGTDIPDLASQTSSSSTALTGWTTSIGKGGRLKFVLGSANTVRSLTILLKALR